MTDWNQRYANADTPWDKGAPSPPLAELLEHPESSRWFGSGPVLVPGCGAGHDVRLLAKHFKSEIIGIDLAPLALDKARAGMESKNEHYEEASWFEFDLPNQAKAGAIWEHTCYCAIHPSERTTYANSVRRLLKVGGYFFGVFFLETGSDEGPPWPSTIEELKERFANGFELIFEQAPEKHYEGREGCEILLGWRKSS